MSTADVCLILETSAKAGVTELKFRDLHVSFGSTAEHEVEPISYPVMPQTLAPTPAVALTGFQHEQQSQETLETEEVRMREEELARLMVEDPVRYEELLRNGDLSDELDTSDEDGDIDE